MDVEAVVDGVLLWLGIGFLAVNLYLLVQFVRYIIRRRRALLIWPPPAAPYPSLGIGIAVALALLVAYKLLAVGLPVFGETMMLLYYGGMAPLSRRIARGFYEDGIWANTGFITYRDVGGLSWRETPRTVSLLVTSRTRSVARRLAVPPQHYAAARRLVSDHIRQAVIRPAPTGLDLGTSGGGSGSGPESADNPPGVPSR